MNRRIVAALLSVILLALLAACSGTPSQQTGSSDEALSKCMQDDDCAPNPPPHGGVYTPPPPEPLTTTSLPGCTAAPAEGAGACDGTCDPGFAYCEFAPAQMSYLSDPVTGEYLPCTEVYSFYEPNTATDPTEAWAYDVAYCADSTAADQEALNDWVAANTSKTSLDGSPYGANLSSTQRTLQPAASGYVYLKFFVYWRDKTKCKQLGSACTVPEPQPGN